MIQARVIIALLTTLIFIQGYTQETYVVDSHEIVIYGNSNIQSWSAEVEDFSGTFILHIEEGKITDIENVDIRMEGESIQGSEGRRMNNKIYETLDTDNHPEISFLLRDVLSLAENPGTAIVSARGVITVAGVSRVVEMNTTGQLLSNGRVVFEGKQDLKMSDFRMDPPRAMFGALRTRDEVEVEYRVVLRPE